MKIETMLIPYYPTFTYNNVVGKVEKKVFPSLQEAEEYIDSLNKQGFTHWIFPEGNVDTAGILEFTYQHPLGLGVKTDFVLYVGCITI